MAAGAFNFGAATPQQQQPTSLFTSTPQQQQAPTSSLFGTPPQPQAGSGGGASSSLFGTPAGQVSGFAAVAPQQQQSSWFGASAPAPQFGQVSNVGQSPSMFNTSLVTSAPTQAAPGSSLFSSNTSAFATAPSFSTSFPLQNAGAGDSLLGSSSTQHPFPSQGVLTMTVPSAPSAGGLGGVPNVSRLSTLVLGNDQNYPSGWPVRPDNKAIGELPVPPDVLAVVEALEKHITEQKSYLSEVYKMDNHVDMFCDYTDYVSNHLASTVSVMHKQELQTAQLVRDFQELKRDLDLLAQTRDIPSYSYRGKNLLINYMFELLGKYTKRVETYRSEIESAEVALQSLDGGPPVNPYELWDTLKATKDTIILLAAQLQEIQEYIRSQLTVHKSIGHHIYGVQARPWLNDAIAGKTTKAEFESPLDAAFASASRKRAHPEWPKTPDRVGPTYGRQTPMADSRVSLTDSTSQYLEKTPLRVQELRTPTMTPSYHHPSGIATNLSPIMDQFSPNPSNKRTKK